MAKFNDAFDLAGIQPGETVFLIFDISMNPPMRMQTRMKDDLVATLKERRIAKATVILTDSKVQDVQTFFPYRFDHIGKMHLGHGSGAMFHEAIDEVIRLKAEHVFIVCDGYAMWPPPVASAGLAITTLMLPDWEEGLPPSVAEALLHGQVIEVKF